MVAKPLRSPWWGLALLLLAGCLSPVREEIDAAVCDLAAQTLDLEPMAPASRPPGELPTPRKADAEAGGDWDAGPAMPPAPTPEILPVAFQPGGPNQPPRLQVPENLPGANAPPIRMPENEAERRAYIERLYAPLPDLGPDPQPVPGPTGMPLTLADLQRLALANSPLIKQALADVKAAQGAAIQAGLHPNPIIGYEIDQLGALGRAGQQGVFVNQLIKTAGKLEMAQRVALEDMHNAQVALRRAKYDLITQVRAGYFGVLVARENVKVTRALSRFTDEVYRVQVEQLKAGQAAPYEPMQVRVLAMQARNGLVQARNGYVSAWKQLAAALGLPAMPLTELAGRIDMPVPRFEWQPSLARVLSSHTDVAAADIALRRGRLNLRLAQLTPIPDVSLYFAVEKDFTDTPQLGQANLQIGVPVPIYDNNKGNIIQAQGQLVRAEEQGHQARNSLTSQLSEAFNRYQYNRVAIEYYRRFILPDQVRTYQGVYARYQTERAGKFTSPPTFGDVVQAQQTLALTITNYITTLGALWTSVVDVANLLQTDDLFQLAEKDHPAPVPDLEHLAPLPCCHPCSPLPDPALKGADPNWPAAEPGSAGQPKPRQPEAKPAAPPEAPKPAPPAMLPPAVTTAPASRPVAPLRPVRGRSAVAPAAADDILLEPPPVVGRRPAK